MKSKNLQNDFKEFYKTSMLEESKNIHIENGLKELLYDVVYNQEKKKKKKSTLPQKRNLVLKEITYVLSFSIKDFFNQINNEKKTIYSASHVKCYLNRIARFYLYKLRHNFNNKKIYTEYLEKSLVELYRSHDTITTKPIIQFIYWSIKNIPRLCINLKKDSLECEVNEILKNYFDIVFFVIDEYKKSNKEKNG